MVSKQKTILFYLSSSHLGGAERVAIDVVQHFKKHSKHIIVVLIPESGPIENVFMELNINYEILSFRGFEGVSFANGRIFGAIFLALPYLVKYYLNYLKVLRRYQVNYVYTHGRKPAVLSCLAKLFYKFDLVQHLHQYPLTGKSALLERFLLKQTKAAISTSKSVKDEYLHVCSSLNVTAIYPKISNNQFYSIDTTQARQKLGLNLPTNAKVVGMITAVAPWKGLEVFCRALVDVMRQDSSVYGLIVGDVLYKTSGHSSYLDDLKSLVKELGLQERFVFLPFQRDPNIAFSTLDVFVHASLSPEPFGRVISEARLCTRPTIATAGGGASEQITDGVDGRLVESGNVSELTQAIKDLLQKNEATLNLIDQGVKWVQANLNEGRFADELTDFWSGL